MVQPFPSISEVLRRNGRPDLIDYLTNCCRSKNSTIIEHAGKMFSDQGLGYITDAVKQCVNCCNARLS
uniref:Uncharacterized protein n=1 Tax=Globodera rostochiensis TaxID=31243 RepID=A0A914HQ99_GLORO